MRWICSSSPSASGSWRKWNPAVTGTIGSRAAARRDQGNGDGLPGEAEPARAHGQRAAGDGRPGIARRQRLDRLDAEAAAVSGRRGERTARSCSSACRAPCSSCCSSFCRCFRWSCSASGAPRATPRSPTGTWTTTPPSSVKAPISPFSGRSLLMAAVVAVICLVYAWPCAYLIAKHGGRYRLLLVLLTAAPFLTGPPALRCSRSWGRSACSTTRCRPRPAADQRTRHQRAARSGWSISGSRSARRPSVAPNFDFQLLEVAKVRRQALAGVRRSPGR